MKCIHLIIATFFFSIGFTQEKNEFPQSEEKYHFYHTISTGLLAGEEMSGSFQVVNGYHFNRYLGMGFGMGTERYFGDFSYALFVQGRLQFGKQKTQFFSTLNLGMSEPADNDFRNQGGGTGTIAFGMQRFVGKHFAITSSLGYRYSIFQIRNSWWDDYLTTAYLNQLELRIGICIQ